MRHQAGKMHIKASIKLKEQEAAIEKSLEYFFNNMKINSDVVQNVMQECQYLSDERHRIESSLRNTIFEVNADFEAVRWMVNQLHNDQNIDIDSCRRKMEELLEKIDQFNVQSELEILITQQKELDDTLNEFKVKLPKYCEKSSAADVTRKTKSASKSDENGQDFSNYDEINNFHSLIVQTGHTQNWKEEDHIYFLNVRKKCPNIPTLVVEMQKRCPDLSAENIVNHEAWYKIYLDLRKKQRESINAWRKRKELERKKKIEAMKDIEIGTFKMKCQKKSDDGGVSIGTNKVSKVTSCSKMNGDVGDERKELINQWKIQKENSRIADEDLKEQRSKALRAWKQKQFSMHATEIREAVARYKQNKDEIKSRLLSNPHTDNNKIIKSSALIKSLRKKDEEFLNRRKNLMKMKYQKSMKNHYNVVTDRCPRPIDQSTLMKPTRVWSEKCKQEMSENQSPKPILYIKDLPKLALNNRQNQTSLSFI